MTPSPGAVAEEGGVGWEPSWATALDPHAMQHGKGSRAPGTRVCIVTRARVATIKWGVGTMHHACCAGGRDDAERPRPRRRPAGALPRAMRMVALSAYGQVEAAGQRPLQQRPLRTVPGLLHGCAKQTWAPGNCSLSRDRHHSVLQAVVHSYVGSSAWSPRPGCLFSLPRPFWGWGFPCQSGDAATLKPCMRPANCQLVFVPNSSRGCTHC